jgi:hypothetical protein
LTFDFSIIHDLMQWLDKNLFCLIFDRSMPGDCVRLSKTCVHAFRAYHIWIERQCVSDHVASMFSDLPRSFLVAVDRSLGRASVLVLGFFRNATVREDYFQALKNPLLVAGWSVRVGGLLKEGEWPTPSALKSMLIDIDCVIVCSSGFMESDMAEAFGAVLADFVKQNGKCVISLPCVESEGCRGGDWGARLFETWIRCCFCSRTEDLNVCKACGTKNPASHATYTGNFDRSAQK